MLHLKGLVPTSHEHRQEVLDAFLVQGRASSQAEQKSAQLLVR